MEDRGTQKILIIGGGFGGISCALNLAKERKINKEIILISDKTHFEYTPLFYQAIFSKKNEILSISMNEIFENKNIKFINDKITEVNFFNKRVKGESGNFYPFNYLVLSVGSETNYFDIMGIEHFSFGLKSFEDVQKLKQHILYILKISGFRDDDFKEDIRRLKFVIVGAGPTGIELGGELAVYLRRLSKNYNINKDFISIDIIDAAPRILPSFPDLISKKVHKRLEEIGVNIFVNKPILRENAEAIMIQGDSIKTDTVIWTAGVRPNRLLGKINGLKFDERGRVLVDKYLRADGLEDVYVIGDGSAMEYSGTAQEAIMQGRWAAKNIINSLKGKHMLSYNSKPHPFLLPVGGKWAVFSYKNFSFSGITAWALRKLADLRYFFSILPFKKFLKNFRIIFKML